jgi:hypothetical protein
VIGFGVGLRPKHYREFLEQAPPVDFVEAISENFMGIGGRPLAVLEKVRRDRPVCLHGVSLAIASVAPLDERYLAQWKALVERIEPAVVSDHLCWGRAHGRYAHDLLPVPFTEEAIAHVVSRVQQVQDFLGRRIALENVSSYLEFASSELTEWEFFAEVVRRADCEVLLDVNNVFVSSRNHGFDAEAYIDAMPRGKVVQVHLAGHRRGPEVIIDTHDGPVSDEVWGLYARAVGRLGPVSTLIEWDDAVPELSVLVAEAEKARLLSLSPAGGEGQGEGKYVRGAARGLSLGETQRVLFEAVCSAVEVSAAAVALVRPAPQPSPRSRRERGRVELYAGMYWHRMRDVLRDAFRDVLARVGDERFDGLVADFLREHPSTHHSLDRLGAPFPQFLETAQPELAALAALEWARAEAFLALDAPVLSFSSLQAHPPEAWPDLSLTAHPSVRVTGATVVWRKGFEVFHADVSEPEARALEHLRQGAPLTELLSPFEDDASAAFTALQSWFSEGMVSQLAFAIPRDERAD